jgi:hypothetical protein
VLSKILQIVMLRGPIDLHWGPVLGSIWPAMATTTVMAAAVLAARLFIGDLGGSLIRLIVLVVVGALTYVGFGSVAFRRVFASARGDLRTVFFGGKVRRRVDVEPDAREA